MNLTGRHLLALAAISLLILGTGCEGRDPASLDVSRSRIAPVVFQDGSGDDSVLEDDVYFQPFSGTYAEAVSIDSVYAYRGGKSLKITVPPKDSALGAFAGGVLTSVAPRDLADFDALTFYARSSIDCDLNVAGFGNDNTGTSLYEVKRDIARDPFGVIRLTSDWTFAVIPIPSPSRLIAERGMFFFSEGWEEGHPLGHEIWIDEVRFASLDDLSYTYSVLPSRAKHYFLGSSVSLAGAYSRFTLDGGPVDIDHQADYFDLDSSDPAVAKVERGNVRIVGTGSATITATMNGIAAYGRTPVNGYVAPTVAAASPTLPAADVISMFSDVYSNVPVDTWNPYWSDTENSYFAVAGDNTIMYSSLSWVAILFSTQTINASEMTHFHLDVYAPTGTNFKVKVVPFDGDGGTELEGEGREVVLNAYTTPAFTAGGWSSLDIPMDDFGLAVTADHIGMLVLSSDDAQLVLVDNIFWHK